MTISSASSLRIAFAQFKLSDVQRLACLSRANWVDSLINQRADTLAYINEYAVDGKIRVEVAYRSSGWGGIDDSCVRNYTLNASVREYMNFCRELRRDCDGCDASVGLVHFN